jgi:hypothetical protein
VEPSGMGDWSRTLSRTLIEIRACHS